MDVWLWNVMHKAEQRGRLSAHEKNKRLYFSERKEDNKYIQDVVQVLPPPMGQAGRGVGRRADTPCADAWSLVEPPHPHHAHSVPAQGQSREWKT